ncbi:helix-turn-helix domain containing protein [Candidatus Poribacteria bacterium]|nr:helix-turn-helix domain containing protein [Candidatus Poribacteria bacterium]
MTRPKPDPKADALREQGCMHPSPEKVVDELFASGEFFDARDVVQVKYEMLRRVRVDGLSVSNSAARFGLSRPSYYQAQGAFDQGGLPALLPKKPGPRGAHKLSAGVMTAIDEALADNPGRSADELVLLVAKRFGLSVHRRSIERALLRQEKNADDRDARHDGDGLGGAHRTLRGAARSCTRAPSRSDGARGLGRAAAPRHGLVDGGVVDAAAPLHAEGARVSRETATG